jgi:hypothetical protein
MVRGTANWRIVIFSVWPQVFPWLSHRSGDVVTVALPVIVPIGGLL